VFPVFNVIADDFSDKVQIFAHSSNKLLNW
jgi:hypothetical protein